MRARAAILFLLPLLPAALAAADPLAVDDLLLAVQGSPLVFDDQLLMSNDTPEGGVMLELVSWPAGALSLKIAGNSTAFTYTALSDNSVDSFSYRLVGATASSDVAVVSLRVTSRVPIAGHWQTGACDAGSGDGLGWYDVPTATFSLCQLDLDASKPEDRLADCRKLPAGISGLGWTPLVGDWDDDGWDDVGLRQEISGEVIRFLIPTCNPTGLTGLASSIAGREGDLTVVGRWIDVDELAFYRPSELRFVFNATPSSGLGAIPPLTLGDEEWLPRPAAGDWDQDGEDTVALYDHTTGSFHFTDDLEQDAASQTFHPYSLGAGLSDPRTTLPVAGAWLPRDLTVPITPPATLLGLFDAATEKDFYLYLSLVDASHAGPLHVRVRDDPHIPPDK